MTTATGRIERTAQKVVKGGSTVYSFKLDNGQWYKTAFDKPNVKDGDSIEFDYNEGQWGNDVVKGSIKLTQAAAPGGNASQGKKAASFDGGSRDDYWAKKEAFDKKVTQPLIMYQSATNVSKDLAIAALNNGILPTAGKAKADKYESFMHIVREIRDDVYREYMDGYATLSGGGTILQPAAKEAEPEALVPDEQGFVESDNTGWE